MTPPATNPATARPSAQGVAPMRFGIMCAGTRLARWQAECVNAVVESGLAVPRLLILDASPGQGPAPFLSSGFASGLRR